MEIKNSARLSYQLMSNDDSEFLFQLDQDPEVMRFINGGKITTREEIASIFLPRMNSFKNPKQGWGLWKVSLSASNQPIGWILVRPMNFFSEQSDDNNLELGWRFLKSSWGKGYAPEAALHIKTHIEENTRIEYFSAVAMEENLASIAVMKKLGMRYIKTDLHADPLGDTTAVYFQMKAK